MQTLTPHSFHSAPPSPTQRPVVEEELLLLILGVEEGLLRRRARLVPEAADSPAEPLTQPGDLLHPDANHAAVLIHPERVAAAADKHYGVARLHRTLVGELPADPRSSRCEAARATPHELGDDAEEDEVAEAVVIVGVDVLRRWPRLGSSDVLVDEGGVVDEAAAVCAVKRPLLVGRR